MPNRECGSCSLCCKVLEVKPLYKAAGQWCKHSRPGQGGCATHQLRPKACRNFSCLWLTEDWLGPEWKPEVAKFVLSLDGPDALLVTADPKQPRAWKREPYYGRLKTLAATALASNQVVVISDGTRKLLLLPDQEVLLGAPADRFTWTINPRPTAEGMSYDVAFERLDAVQAA